MGIRHPWGEVVKTSTVRSRSKIVYWVLDFVSEVLR